MATITGLLSSSALPTSARRILALVSLGDDDMLEAFLVSAIIDATHRFVECDQCFKLGQQNDDELHLQLEVLSRYHANRLAEWRSLWSDLTEAPF